MPISFMVEAIDIDIISVIVLMEYPHLGRGHVRAAVSGRASFALLRNITGRH
ncbi:hypothetical protein [Subtercola lobariae]|nr:hypothetical protein [Subtercola lobariae]